MSTRSVFVRRVAASAALGVGDVGTLRLRGPGGGLLPAETTLRLAILRVE
jgi:hypothetical protein